jgi:uncharacterized protein (TIGR03435 family)
MRRTILSSTLMAALLCGGIRAQTPGDTPAFEVASIKPAQAPPPGRGPLAALREDINTDPGRLTMTNVTLATAIRWAWKLGVYEISGPDWISTTRFDITAKSAAPAPEEQLRLMLQMTLKERFQLAVHRQNKELSGYVLLVGKNGTKLHPVEGGGEGAMTGAGLMFEGHKMPLSRLADIISSALRLPVRDMTNLEGFYDFKVDLRPYLLDRPQGEPIDLPSIATSALDSELGLRLEARKIAMDVLQVDHVEKTPSEN